MPGLPELVEWQLLAGLQLLIEPYALITPLDLLGVSVGARRARWCQLDRGAVGAAGQLPVAAGGRGRDDRRHGG